MMTITELYDHITESVVPETVLPQNIASCLMDENAEIPELDAFTFLNRLRDLGIGSADFIYLLKSCNAPEEAIEKIESNPAMNLQGLIVTLEHAGLQPKDYTRMLYSARKIWERTQTMRISAVLEAVEATKQNGETEQLSDEIHTEKNVADDEHFENAAVEAERLSESDAEDIQADAENSISEHLKGITVISGEELTEIHTAEPTTEEEAKPSETDGVSVKGLAASACGAVILLAFGAVMSCGILPARNQHTPDLRFASNALEVFADIHYAYNSGESCGKNVVALPTDKGRVFCDMLVENTGLDKGVFSTNDYVYSTYSDRVLVYDREKSGLVNELTPPEGCEFIEVFECGDLYAVYYGKKSGVIRLTGSDFNAELCGTLTDYTISENSVTLACVYFPEFTESFKAEQSECYLPFTLINGKQKTIPAERVVLGAEKRACGYAVSVTVDLSRGEITDCVAVLGDAQFCDSDGAYAVVRSENGSQIVGIGEQIVAENTPLITACDYSGGVLCTIETGDEPVAYIRGDDLKPTVAMQNFTETVCSAEISGKHLYISGENGVFSVAELSEESPKTLGLERKDGVILGEYALVGEINGSEVSFVLYSNDGSEAARCSKVIVADTISDFSLSGANTFIMQSPTKCGAAYSYFDGVSFVSEFAQFGAARKNISIYDDRTGFTAAFAEDDTIKLIYSNGSTKIN
ncbi:MAG: hypothetical protein ACI4KM_06825 [Oscillospiraceae bacterium]